MVPQFHIGIDDTDSLKGGCTTYVAALLVEELSRYNVAFIDYPNILRLNPNIPWKTRGNGAICLRLSPDPAEIDTIKEVVIHCVERNSDLASERTDPGVVFLKGEVPEALLEFSAEAVCRIVNFKAANNILNNLPVEAVALKGRRGIIGALAAVGGLFRGDCTYEAIAYRLPENRGKPRIVDVGSVVEMDKRTKGLTFNNIDSETGRILITPRGPDPVLLGIRGETPGVVREALSIVKVSEEIERWVIFRTNHGTDSHFKTVYKINEIRPFLPVVVEGSVASWPVTIPGGHVILTLVDETGEIDCAAYEPTGSFTHVVRMLVPGDKVRVYGGVRKSSKTNPRTINLEKLEILDVAEKVRLVNPSCPRCMRRMSSLGVDKGFECRRCGLKERNLKRVREVERRNLSPGIYIPPPRAHRHLTKPYMRYGREKTGSYQLRTLSLAEFYGLGSIGLHS
ncbi:MAG: tRNA(Ile)(2)-agmatinylcytidine synthase [Candidatus Bathyarchaeia archaeon]